MAAIATQRGSARRIVALALFVLIPLVFGVLALLFLPHKQNDVPMIAPEATLTLLRPMPLNRASGHAATQPTGRRNTRRADESGS
jgi:hypothetical protein